MPAEDDLTGTDSARKSLTLGLFWALQLARISARAPVVGMRCAGAQVLSPQLFRSLGLDKVINLGLNLNSLFYLLVGSGPNRGSIFIGLSRTHVHLV